MFHLPTQIKVTVGFFALLLLIGLSGGLVYHEMSTSMDNNEQELAHVDSVKAQLKQKEQQMENALQAMKTMYNQSEYEPYIDRLIETQDTLINKPQVKHTTTTVTQQYVVKQKKNIFKRIHDVFSPGKGDSVQVKNVSTTEESDSMAQAYNPNDSVKKLLEKTKLRASNQHKQKIRQINRQVKKLKANESEVVNRMGHLVQLMEEENILLKQQQVESMKSARWHSVQILGWIAMTALLLAAVFLFIIIRDIEKGNRYRNQLEEANEKASRLLAEREQLMLTVSHDIKAPAGSILGYTDLLKRISHDERQQTYLNSMKASAQHLLRMVTSLLDYHQLDKHKIKIERLNFQPAQLFDAVYQSFLPLATQKSIQMEYTCDPVLNKTYRGDAFRIRQIAENLMSNALKFTAKGTITLSVRMNNSNLCFSVADTGPGITLDGQQKIFNEFTRLPNAQGQEGFGLGLSITKKLSQLMNGNITVSSVVGKGSTFSVVIPLEPGEQSETIKKPEMPSRRIRLLMIDDDPLQLQLTEAMLAHENIILTTNLHPLNMAKQLKNGDYDAIITDVQMPEMNGFDFVKMIQQAGITTPVYALTARSEMQTEDLRQYGFEGCLHKPFTAEELIATVTKVAPKAPTLPKAKVSPVTKQPSNSPFHFETLTAFAVDDEDAAREIILTFISETKKNCNLIREALKNDEVQIITATAHKMLPVFIQVGEKSSIAALIGLEKQRDLKSMTDEVRKNAETVLSVSQKIIDEAQKWKK